MRNINAVRHSLGERVHVRMHKGIEPGVILTKGVGSTGHGLYWIALGGGHVTTATDGNVL